MMIRLPVGEEGHSDWSGLVFLVGLVIVAACLIEIGFIVLFLLAAFHWKHFLWQMVFALLVILFPLVVLHLYRRW